MLGRPDRARTAAPRGQLDLAPISSIEYARNADGCGSCRACASRPRARSTRSSSSRRAARAGAPVAVTPESATSVVLTKVLLPTADHVPLGEEADAKLLIGDAALQSAFEDPTPHHDLGRLWLERTGLPMVFAVWAAPEPRAGGGPSSRTRSSPRCAPPAPSPERARVRGEPSATAIRAGFLARYFEKLRYRSVRASARGSHVPRAGAGRRRARRRAELRFVTAERRRMATGVTDTATVTTILDKALDGERIADDEALALLELARPGRRRPRRRRAARAAAPTRTGSRSSSTATSTTRTSASPTATSAPSTGARRPPRGLPAAEAGHLQEDRGDARARRHRRC